MYYPVKALSRVLQMQKLESPLLRTQSQQMFSLFLMPPYVDDTYDMTLKSIIIIK